MLRGFVCCNGLLGGEQEAKYAIKAEQLHSYYGRTKGGAQHLDYRLRQHGAFQVVAW
jgi:hypothetical protein